MRAHEASQPAARRPKHSPQGAKNVHPAGSASSQHIDQWPRRRARGRRGMIIEAPSDEAAEHADDAENHQCSEAKAGGSAHARRSKPNSSQHRESTLCGNVREEIYAVPHRPLAQQSNPSEDVVSNVQHIHGRAYIDPLAPPIQSTIFFIDLC